MEVVECSIVIVIMWYCNNKKVVRARPASDVGKQLVLPFYTAPVSLHANLSGTVSYAALKLKSHNRLSG